MGLSVVENRHVEDPDPTGENVSTKNEVLRLSICLFLIACFYAPFKGCLLFIFFEILHLTVLFSVPADTKEYAGRLLCLGNAHMLLYFFI